VLKGVHPLLHADLLHALAAMGHGDELAIVDANFPAAAIAKRHTAARKHSAGQGHDQSLSAGLSAWSSSSVR
jgi:L-fucose mutarotase